MALQEFGEFFIDVDSKGIAQCFSYSFHDFLLRSQELTKVGATLILEGRLFPSTGGGYHAFYQLPVEENQEPPKEAPVVIPPAELNVSNVESVLPDIEAKHGEQKGAARKPGRPAKKA